MEKHEVAIIGGGHNGLIAASYLAKAGLDVCVLERKEKCGGGVMTEELTLPGFKHDAFSADHGMIQANPLMRYDELGLKAKFGLNYITYSPGNAFIFPDDRALVLYDDVDKTCESISRFSARDAEAYPKFLKSCEEMNMILGDYMFSPPPDFGNMISFLEASESGREYLKLLLGSALDVAEDWFESEEMRAAMIRSVSEALVPPQQKGTGNFVFKFATSGHGAVIPEGGSGALIEALMACLRAHGGTIRTSCHVKSIIVKTGEAKGVILESGEEILASKTVISSLNAKQIFTEMLEPEDLPSGLPDKVRRLRSSSFITMKQDIALNEAPKFKAGGDVNKSLFVRIMPGLEDMLRMFEEFTYGIPQTMDLGLGTPTLADSTRAPADRHIIFLWQDEPYNLKNGGPAQWDTIKQDIIDGGLATLRAHTTNMGPQNILGRFARTPLDLERYNPTWMGGDANHIGVTLSQMFSNRPLPGLGHYQTPIEKLYMCGASTHPGPAVSGGSRAAVMLIMEDLGIDFKKVIK